MIHSWNCWEEACRTHPCFFGIALAGGLIMLLKRGSRRPEWIRKTVATHIRVPEIRKLSDRISAVGPSVDLESCVQGLDGAPGTSEREAASLAGPHGEGSVMRTRAVWEVRTLPEHRPGLDSRARRPPDRALSPGLPPLLLAQHEQDSLPDRHPALASTSHCQCHAHRVPTVGMDVPITHSNPFCSDRDCLWVSWERVPMRAVAGRGLPAGWRPHGSPSPVTAAPPGCPRAEVTAGSCRHPPHSTCHHFRRMTSCHWTFFF